MQRRQLVAAAGAGLVGLVLALMALGRPMSAQQAMLLFARAPDGTAAPVAVDASGRLNVSGTAPVPLTLADAKGETVAWAPDPTLQPTGWACSVQGGGELPTGQWTIYGQWVDQYGGASLPSAPATCALTTGTQTLRFWVDPVPATMRVWFQLPGENAPSRYRDFNPNDPDESRVIDNTSGMTLGTMPAGGDFRWTIFRYTPVPAQLDHKLFIGRMALPLGGVGNTIINADTKSLTTGYHNIIVGRGTAGPLKTGYDNIGIGVEAFIHLKSGSGNIGIGREALSGVTDGSNNFALGNQAGWGNGFEANPSFSMYLGRARTNEVAPQGEIVLANDPAAPTYGKGSNTMLLGGANITDSWVAGNVHIKSVQLNEDNIAQPACTAALRGRQWYVRDDVLGDTLQVCIRQAGGSYVWKTVLW